MHISKNLEAERELERMPGHSSVSVLAVLTSVCKVQPCLVLVSTSPTSSESVTWTWHVSAFTRRDPSPVGIKFLYSDCYEQSSKDLVWVCIFRSLGKLLNVELSDQIRNISLDFFKCLFFSRRSRILHSRRLAGGFKLLHMSDIWNC